MSRLLIVNADDYGLSPGVSEGILRAAATGIVSSTTVMANLAKENELCRLKESGLPYGCHLNLSCGRPAYPYPVELLDSAGEFRKDLALDPTTWAEQRFQGAVADEWYEQQVLLAMSDCRPDHLDSHHHVHLLEPLFPVALWTVTEGKMGSGLGLRVRAEQVAGTRAAGVKCPGEFIEGFFGFGNIDMSNLLALLEATTADAVELMCHPGYVDQSLKQRSSYLHEREAELEVLADPELKSRVEQMGWTLGGYDDLHAYIR